MYYFRFPRSKCWDEDSWISDVSRIWMFQEKLLQVWGNRTGNGRSQSKELFQETFKQVLSHRDLRSLNYSSIFPPSKEELAFILWSSSPQGCISSLALLGSLPQDETTPVAHSYPLKSAEAGDRHTESLKEILGDPGSTFMCYYRYAI